MRLRIVPARLAFSAPVNHVKWAPQAVLGVSVGATLAVARSPVYESPPQRQPATMGALQGVLLNAGPVAAGPPCARPQPGTGEVGALGVENHY